MDFRKVIYENVKKKKHSFDNKHIYMYHRRFEVLWSFFFYLV